MRFLLTQAGRFGYWVQQGGNLLSFILAVVTTAYTVVNYRMLSVFGKQLDVARDQFDLAQKQFAAAYVPRLKVGLAFALENTRIVQYEIENKGQNDVEIIGVSIDVDYGKGYHHPCENFPRTISSVGISAKFEDCFEIPEEYEIGKNEAQWYSYRLKRLSVKMSVREVGSLISYDISYRPTTGYDVKPIFK